MMFNDCPHHQGGCTNYCPNHPVNKKKEEEESKKTWNKIHAAEALIRKIDELGLTELKEERDNLERTLWHGVAPCDL